MSNAVNRSTIVVNTFTPKPGELDSFIAVQTAALPGLAAQIEGFIGSRLYRAEDGSKAVMISVFATPESVQQFTGSEAFSAHRARISQFLDRAEPARFEVVYESGNI